MWLLEECAGDPALLEEVSSLLSAHVRADSRFDRPPVLTIDSRAESLTRDPVTGDRVGPYRLDRLLGRGGMARVFLALPEDGTGGRPVAIKVLREDLAGDEILRRFRAEQHVLSALDHPYIARLLDAWTTEQDRPYLVMEHVEGRPIDLYCEQWKLSVAQRLALFEKVCEAVHFAHQNLVVHRDLKPANILVTADGQPKLLDFGIAKLLQPGRVPVTVVPTVPGLQPMTPEYASPEQIRGEIVTTASDVYALGVLLYLLLVGRVPFPSQGSFDQATLRRICEEDPELPSRAVARLAGGTACPPDAGAETNVPASHPRRLAGDLDRIVLKALRKDPRERYRSAEQLAEDVRRHLDGHPVRAREPTVLYLASRFFRRHRWGVATAAAAVVALAVFAAVLELQQRQTARQRDRAEAVSGFLVELFETAEPGADGSDLTARQLLERGARRIDEQLAGQPQSQVALKATIGSAFLRLGLAEQAGEQFETALALGRETYPGDHPETARALRHLGYQRYSLGRYEAAASLFVEALDMGRRLHGDEHPDVAEALRYLGVAHRELGEYRTAEPMLRRALAISRRVDGGGGRARSDALYELTQLLFLERRLAEALPLIEESVELDRELLGEDHPDYATSLGTLGQIHYALGDLEAAQEQMGRAVEIRRRVLDPDHEHVATGLHDLAVVAMARGRYREARRLFEESSTRYRSRFPEGHPHLEGNLKYLSDLMMVANSPEEAVPLLQEALELREKFPRGGEFETLQTGIRLAEALRRAGRTEEARRLEQGFEERLADVEPEHRNQRGPLLEMRARLRLAAGEPEQAARLFRQALAARREVYGDGHQEVGRALGHLGRSLHAAGRHAEAEAAFAGAVETFRRGLPAAHPELGLALRRVAEERLHQGRPGDAEEPAREALGILRQALEPGAGATCLAAVALAAALRGQERPEDEAVVEEAGRELAAAESPLAAERCGLPAAGEGTAPAAAETAGGRGEKAG